jgi:hypothetical protein
LRLRAYSCGLRSSGAKNNFAIGRGHYHVKHEPCWYAVRKSGTGHWAGDRSQTTLWQIDKNLKSETGHSTQKPVECMRRPIENNSSPGQAVYEPFCGSGTTIIAAAMTGIVDYRVDATSCRVKLDGPFPSELFRYNQLTLNDAAESLQPAEKAQAALRLAPLIVSCD